MDKGHPAHYTDGEAKVKEGQRLAQLSLPVRARDRKRKTLLPRVLSDTTTEILPSRWLTNAIEEQFYSVLSSLICINM